MTDHRHRTKAPRDPERRRILTGAPLAGAAALAVASGVRASESGSAEDAAADGRDPVYRETDHVKAYYARARE